MSADEPLFLDVDDVLELHATQLRAFGGSVGVELERIAASVRGVRA